MPCPRCSPGTGIPPCLAYACSQGRVKGAGRTLAAQTTARCSLELRATQAESSHLPHCPPSDDASKNQRDQERQNTVSGYSLVLTAHPLLMAFPYHTPGEHMLFAFFFCSVLAEQQQAFLHHLLLPPPLANVQEDPSGTNTEQPRDSTLLHLRIRSFSPAPPFLSLHRRTRKALQTAGAHRRSCLPFQPFPTSTTAAQETFCREGAAMLRREQRGTVSSPRRATLLHPQGEDTEKVMLHHQHGKCNRLKQFALKCILSTGTGLHRCTYHLAVSAASE